MPTTAQNSCATWADFNSTSPILNSGDVFEVSKSTAKAQYTGITIPMNAINSTNPVRVHQMPYGSPKYG